MAEGSARDEANRRTPIVVLTIHADLFRGTIQSAPMRARGQSLPDVRFRILTATLDGRANRGDWPLNVSFVVLSSWIGRLEERIPSPIARLLGAGIEIAQAVRFRRTVRRESFDLLHVHMGMETESLVRVGRRTHLRGFWVVARWLNDFAWTKKPVLFTDHGLFSRRTEFGHANPLHEGDLAVTSAYRNVICVTSDGFRYLREHDRRAGRERQSWFVPNGIDASRFSPAPFPEESALRVGYAGRLFRRGEPREFLLEVARSLPEGVEMRMILATSLSEEELRARWFPAPRVHIARNVPYGSMPDFYRSIDLFFNPMLWGLIDRTTLEAMSCGRPVVMFNNADRDPVTDETGYLVPPGDPQALLNLFLHLRNRRKELSAKGATARAVILSRFDQRIVGPQTESIYRGLAAMSGERGGPSRPGPGVR